MADAADRHVVVGYCVHDGVSVSVAAVGVFILTFDLREGFEEKERKMLRII